MCLFFRQVHFVSVNLCLCFSDRNIFALYANNSVKDEEDVDEDDGEEAGYSGESDSVSIKYREESDSVSIKYSRESDSVSQDKVQWGE